VTPAELSQMAAATRPARSARRERPLHLRLGLLALVAAGGAIGTGLREVVTLVVPQVQEFPVATFAINLVGAFALGLLLESLARSGPDVGRRRGIRLFVGTGLLGGFTTYSALATATAMLGADGYVWWAVAYALGTVVLGAVMSTAGILTGRLLTPRKSVTS
jgi:CrcB protein